MWLACGVMVFIVIAQSVVYLRSAIREADRLGIDAKRRHGAIRSACITSLGPSLSPVIIALSMITIIGAPNTWLYLNNVGAARTELATAAIGAEFAGVFELGDNIGMSALSCAMWACALNGVGWMIVVFFLNHRMQRISDALYAKFDRALVSALMGAAVTSLFCYLLGNQLVSGSWRHYLAAAISGGCMLLLGYICKGHGVLQEISLGVSMLAGKYEIPIWRKYTLSVQEASKYFHIGDKKLRKLIDENPGADFILWNGTRPQIKRRVFERYVDEKLSAI